MTTYTVPTEFVGPGGISYMLPGHALWTDTVTLFGKTVTRDVTDAFRYWLLNYVGGTFVGTPGGRIPMSGPVSAFAVPTGPPNTIQFRAGVGTYWMEYGFKLGAFSHQVSGGSTAFGITGWSSRADGTLAYMTWPAVPDYNIANLIFDLNGATIAQGQNQPEERVKVDLPGVLTAGSATITGVTIPTVDSVGDPIVVSALLGDEIRCNVPTYDPAAPADGGGWVFTGNVALGSNQITNVVAKYGTRPLSQDWVGHAIQNTGVGVFTPRPPGAIISAVSGTTLTITRADNAAPFLSSRAATGQTFYFDDQRAFPINTTILSVSPASPGTNRTIVASDPSNFSWGLAAGVPKAPVERPGLLLEPRKHDGVALVAFGGFSSDVTIRNGTLRMGNPVGNSGTFTPHESWYLFLFRACTRMTLEDLTLRNAWSDMFNFTGFPTDTVIRNVDADYCGRHMFTLEGEQGLLVEDSEFKHPARWMMDTESVTGARMLDHTFRRCKFSHGFGMWHFRPGVDPMPAPVYLNGCTLTAGSRVVSFSNHSAPWPINRKDVNRTDNSTPLFSGPLTVENLGAIVTGPGIEGWHADRPHQTYITQIGPFGTSAILSKPAVSNQTGVQLVLGQTANTRGIHFDDCQHLTKNLEMWFHGISAGYSEFWFQGRTLAGSNTITNLVFPACPDGSPTPYFFDVLPADGTAPPRTWCVYNNVFTGKRVVINGGNYLTPSFTTNEPAKLTGTFWFYADGIRTWMSDFSMEDCTGAGMWSGAHFSDVAGGSPLIQLAHLMADVTIRRNVNPSNPNASGGPKEVTVGTTNDKDFAKTKAEFDAGFIPYPRDTSVARSATAPSIGPPWSTGYNPATGRGNPRWSVSGNYWRDAIDNQVTVTVSTWVNGLTSSAALGTAGSGTTPPRYGIAVNEATTITATILHPFDATVIPGEMTLVVNGVERMSVPIVANTATFNLPANFFVQGVFGIGVRYPGAVVGSSAYEAGTFRSVFFGAGYPGWQTITMFVGAATEPDPTATTIEATPDPAFSTQLVTVTAAVAGTAPTGTVTIDNGQAIIAQGPIVGGEFEVTQTFPPGTYLLTAHYLGDSDNEPSVSAPFELVVEAAVPSAWSVGVVQF